MAKSLTEQVARHDWAINYGDELTSSYKYHVKTTAFLPRNTPVDNVRTSNSDLTRSYTLSKFQADYETNVALLNTFLARGSTNRAEGPWLYKPVPL